MYPSIFGQSANKQTPPKRADKTSFSDLIKQSMDQSGTSASLPPHHAFALSHIEKSQKDSAEGIDSKIIKLQTGTSIADQDAQVVTKRLGDFADSVMNLSEVDFEGDWEGDIRAAYGDDDRVNQMIEGIRQVQPTPSMRSANKMNATLKQKFGQAAQFFDPNKTASGEGIDGQVLQEDILAKLSDDEYARALQFYQELVNNPPVQPGMIEPRQMTDLEKITTSVLMALFPEETVALSRAVPDVLAYEANRRNQLTQGEFNQKYGTWVRQVGAGADALQQARMSRNDTLDALTTMRGQDIASADRRYAVDQMGVRQDDKQQSDHEKQWIKILTDPKISAEDREGGRRNFQARYGYDPLGGNAINPSYVENKANAESGLINAKTDLTFAEITKTLNEADKVLADTAYTNARTWLTEEQAQKVGIEAALLGPKFEFEKWKAMNELEEKVRAGRSKSAKDRDSVYEMLLGHSTKLRDQAKGYRDQAQDKLQEAATLENEGKTEEAKKMRDQAEVLNLKAQTMDERADEYAGRAEDAKNAPIDESGLSAMPESDVRSVVEKIKARGEQYSMSKRGSDKYTDCSEFTQCAYKDLGFNIPPTASTQWDDTKSLDFVAEDDQVQVGDLVFFKDSTPSAGRTKNSAHHVGIISGFDENGEPIMTHASSVGNRVMDVNLNEYERQVRGSGLTRLGFKRAKGKSASSQPEAVTKQAKPTALADSSSMLASVHAGFPKTATEQLFALFDGKVSGWGRVDDVAQGDLIYLYDADGENVTNVRAGTIIGVKPGNVIQISFGPGKVFEKKIEDLNQKGVRGALAFRKVQK